MMKKIDDFEIVNHGIMYSVDCDSGDFDHSITGFGENFAEAICDCIESMKKSDFNIKGFEKRILEQMDWDSFPTEPFVDVWDNRRFKNHCKSFYHVSVRWNETHKLPIRIGGLMRCCIYAIEEMNSGKEGDIINCKHCNSSMQVKNGAWEWVR